MAVMPGTEGQIDQQKAALLASIAAQGTQGQVAFQAEAQRRAAAQQAAQAQIAAATPGATGNGGGTPKALTAQMTAQQGMLNSIYNQDASLSKAGFDNSIAQTSAANSAYMQQAAAAVPIVRSQTEGVIAQIRKEQEEAEAERQFQAQERIAQAAADAEDRAWAREQMGFEREQMAADRADKKSDLSDDAIAEAQDSTFRAATREDDAPVVTVLEAVADAADDLPQAMKYASRVIDDAVAAAEESGEAIPGWTKNTRTQIARRLYQYFTTKEAPKDLDELNKALAGEGSSLSDVIPGYTPPSEAVQGGQSRLGVGSAGVRRQDLTAQYILSRLQSHKRRRPGLLSVITGANGRPDYGTALDFLTHRPMGG